ncbi:chemotaxis response regulator protein-glutamate methylesterase CheB [Gottschalkia acidurici 9a]|uniref:Protein-glutamate methylesterase/protein-glutamine glutaminase n=1 Tax=Gottschalkia acidurici (strain ATCC 7906 / DSM 604 / BCRC 14475 / CIP 104303 / KCTC 5404 / NCIMB 10678 / 9a) TaxID=1128398 RepID=K0B227_GOTA9|nr:chemotaxis response regulator protein-glutamate methylesterase [Gottschalkia acidurici]AFS79529.1 chemotaxis response regulator protein-glutamate methylesterase CheB [Gottschalkia acidurici 9a]
MSIINVLVVDDSAFMRQVLRNIINSQVDMKVIGIARDGIDAIEKAKSLKPDVITLDIEMPRMNGSEALKVIMEEAPTKVLMVSSLTSRNAEITMKCLSYGAFDFIEKPSGKLNSSFEAVTKEFLEAIRNSVNVDINSLIPKKIKSDSYTANNKGFHPKPSISSPNKILLIASSTGGPRSLEKIIPLLPADIGCPGIVVQHMPAGFTKSLAERLNKVSNLTVKEAVDGEPLKNNTIYIAPGDYHLGLQKVGTQVKLFLDSSQKINNVRPAADFTFEMAADIYGRNIVCAVLTGMGKDGAQGALKIKNMGGKVIAESKNTCVVYGMPKAVVDDGSADFILDNTEIADKIISLL